MPHQTDAPAAERADDALMARLVRGDPEALRLLMNRHCRVVLNVVYRMTSDQGVAEDLTQETFLRVFDKAGHYQAGRGSARPWIVTIARNLALKHLRRRAIEERPPTRRRSTTHPANNPATTAELGELGDKIQEALMRVDEPYRSAVVLCVLEGQSYEDAAAACGCSVKTLSSRLARGRARFRQLMTPYLRGRTRAEL